MSLDSSASLLRGAAWIVAVFIAAVAVPAPASATLLFSFSDTGGGTTLVSASGSMDLTGTTAATSVHLLFVGWDNLGGAGDQSTALVADSDFFSFQTPNVGGIFSSYNATLGTTALNVSGVHLNTSGGLGLDGTGATSQFFTLRFTSNLPQSGVVTAGGSAVVDIDFADLPYIAGESVDLQDNGNVVFEFVPEPSFPLLLASGLAALAAARSRRAL